MTFEGICAGRAPIPTRSTLSFGQLPATAF